jgi:hypothetical protein
VDETNEREFALGGGHAGIAFEQQRRLSQNATSLLLLYWQVEIFPLCVGGNESVRSLVRMFHQTLYRCTVAGVAQLQSEFSILLPSLMEVIMRKRPTVLIRNIRNPTIRKMSPMLNRYNAAWSASISHCPLPLTFQIGAAGWNVVEIPTDGITPLFNDVTKALQVIPSKIKNPPFTLAPMM